jgi:hypothetical protein
MTIVLWVGEEHAVVVSLDDHNSMEEEEATGPVT